MIRGGGGEMVLIASPNNMALPGAVATATLPDLHAIAAGQATRVLPRQTRVVSRRSL